jgi:hypothetical protein
MNALDLVWTAIFLGMGGWFFARNRKGLSGSAVARHIIFMAFVWAGCIAFFHGDAIVRWVFGREIYKGDPKETAAVGVRLGATILSFAAAAISLGKDRVRQFKLYGETFPVHKVSSRQ